MTDVMTDGGAGTDGARAARPAARSIVLLIGPAGAGKGTQAAILSRRLGLPHLSSGDLFRDALRQGSPLGEQARAFMERGDLVPDDLTIGLVMDRLARPDTAAGAILDGFPRTAAQARALDATLAERGERVASAIFLELSPEEVVHRIAGRRICPRCETPYHLESKPPRTAGRCDREGAELQQRDDDRPEVVRARLAKQIPPMLDVVDHYRRAGRLTRVDGRQGIEAVTNGILAAVAPAGAGVSS